MLTRTGRFISLALVAGLTFAGLSLAGSGFMVMVPALFLLALLLLGSYLGESRIHRIRRAIAARRLTSVTTTRPAAERTGDALIFRGGRLIACSIAVRPPPLAA